MKKLTLALTLGLLVFSSLHAQQQVVIERTGVLSDLASAVGTIIALPLATVEGIAVGTVEAAGSLIQGSTQIVVAPPARAPAPIIVAPTRVMVTPPTIITSAPVAVPTTTIITTHGDGSVTTVTRRASAYELGSVVLTPVDPTHRVGTSPHVNPYVYRYH